MKNLVTQCCVFFCWVVIFSSILRECTALQSYRGADVTLQLEALKTGMLEYLEMDRPPVLRRTPPYSDLIKMYHEYRNMRWNVSSFQRSSSFFLNAAVQPLHSQESQKAVSKTTTQWFRAVFHMDSNLPEKFVLAQAQLQLQTQSMENVWKALIPQKIQLRIHDSSHSYMKEDFDTSIFNMRGNNVTLDITFAVDKWLMNKNKTFLIADIGFIRKKNGKSALTPQLCLELKLLVSNERKRRSIFGESFGDNSHCTLKSLIVSFEEIGWSDWIVAPAGYTMYFCDGSCPNNYKPASMHTQIKFRLHRLTKGATPRPCCVPAAYEPMILMHYDSRGKLKLTSFDDLIVTKCHCA